MSIFTQILQYNSILELLICEIQITLNCTCAQLSVSSQPSSCLSCIEEQELKRPVTNTILLPGLAGGAAAHEMFLADHWNDMVRSIDVLPGRHDTKVVYEFEYFVEEVMHDVAYSVASDSLFVATRHKDLSKCQRSLVHPHKTLKLEYQRSISVPTSAQRS